MAGKTIGSAVSILANMPILRCLGRTYIGVAWCHGDYVYFGIFGMKKYIVDCTLLMMVFINVYICSNVTVFSIFSNFNTIVLMLIRFYFWIIEDCIS